MTHRNAAHLLASTIALGLAQAGCDEATAAGRPVPSSTELTRALVLRTSAASFPALPPAARPPSACPDGMVSVDHVCVDRYEASLAEVRAGGEVAWHAPYERPAAGVAYEARSAPDRYPQAYISREEARDACTRADKRLCTMREWQIACEGARGTDYPYGNHAEPGRCNTDKPHLLSMRFGWDPRHWHYDDFNDPSLDQEPGFLAKAGQYAGCVSDAGVHDLVGNLHEWVSDRVDGAFVGRLESDGVLRAYQPWASGNGVFMGGFFSTHGEHGPGCRFTTIAHDPSYHDYSVGFRCCKDEASP